MLSQRDARGLDVPPPVVRSLRPLAVVLAVAVLAAGLVTAWPEVRGCAAQARVWDLDYEGPKLPLDTNPWRVRAWVLVPVAAWGLWVAFEEFRASALRRVRPPYRLVFLLILFVWSIALGVAGFAESSGDCSGWADRWYATLALFVGAMTFLPGMDFNGQYTGSDQLTAARVLALAAAAAGILAAATELLRPHVDRLRAARITDAIVVCGLGRVGAAFVTSHDLGQDVRHRLTAVEEYTDPGSLEATREHRVRVLIGDATDESVLQRALGRRPDRLLALASDSVVNLAIVETATRLVGDGRSEHRFVVRARVDELSLCDGLQLQEMVRASGQYAARVTEALAREGDTLPTASGAYRIDYFNPYEMAAKDLLEMAAGRDPSTPSSPPESYRLVICGTGRLAEALMVMAAREAYAHAVGALPALAIPVPLPSPPFEVVLIDTGVDEFVRTVRERWPEVDERLLVRTHSQHATPDLVRGLARDGRPTVIVVAAEPTGDSLGLAHTLSQALPDAAVYVWGREHGAAAGHAVGAEGGPTVIDVWSMAAKPSHLLEDLGSWLAWENHRGYHLSQGTVPTEEDFTVEANLSQILHLIGRLSEEGFEVRRADGSEPARLSGIAVESLARSEHQRWLRAKLARVDASLDHEEMVGRGLVHWDALVDENPVHRENKEKTRAGVTRVVLVLALAGYRVVALPGVVRASPSD